MLTIADEVAQAPASDLSFAGSDTANIVTDHILEGLRTGNYAPGQRLIEGELSERLGVGRGTVREAIRWLAAAGFVDLEKNRGASVRRLSRAKVREIFSVLEALTHLALREIVQRIDDRAVRAGIAGSLRQTRAFKLRAKRELPLAAYRDENIRFHNALYALADNQVLADVRARLRLHILRIEWQGMMNTGSAGDWTAGHEETLMAALEGDADKAIKAKMKGLAKVRAAILALPESAFGDA